VLLSLVRGKDLGEQIDRSFGLRAALYRHLVSIVTHGEIKALAERNSWNEEKRSILTAALNNLITLNIDNESLVDAYVKVADACRNNAGSERTMGQNDMWIAATALVAGLRLITTDKDFDHLNGRLLRSTGSIRVLEDRNRNDRKRQIIRKRRTGDARRSIPE
jgi:tRNA(fMet)-specific endonuclease VapC